MRTHCIGGLCIAFSVSAFSALLINYAQEKPLSSSERQLLHARRSSPQMISRTGRCEMLGIRPFEDQIFPCKIKTESGRGWVIFAQPLGSDDDAYSDGSYLTFTGYSEECGFGIGCPMRFKEQVLSKLLKRFSSPNHTPSDYYIRKWDESELKLVFDKGNGAESVFSFKAYK